MDFRAVRQAFSFRNFADNVVPLLVLTGIANTAGFIVAAIKRMPELIPLVTILWAVTIVVAVQISRVNRDIKALEQEKTARLAQIQALTLQPGQPPSSGLFPDVAELGIQLPTTPPESFES